MKFSKAEIEAIIEASCRTFVPLHQLVLSTDYQARTAGSTPKMSIQELAASIRECGILQNLIVVKGARNSYEVCAGGRRLEAMSLLVSAGSLPENYPVPVLVVPADRGLMASLAENAFHVPMHPADEFEAFGRLMALGKSAEDVAAAFGVTPLVVRRRMKLAAVSPRLMAQFREDKITLDCLMVLASVDDHERQEQAWAGLDSWNRHADALRRVLTQGEIESDRSPVAKYVTVKAYEKAGGPTRRDLFSASEKKVYLLDPQLLDQLAVAKLQRKAKQVAAEGWKWVDVRPRLVHDEYQRCGELRKSSRAPTDAEAAELADLQTQIAQRSDQMEAMDEGDEEAYAQLESECDDLSARLSALQDALSVWQPELMAQAGCVVHVGNDGSPGVRYGLIRPEDRDEMARAAQASRGVKDEDESNTGSSPAADACVSLPSAKPRATHSERLTRNLTAHRVAAIQAELLGRPDVAIAALTAQLAGKLLLDSYQHRYSLGDPLTFSVTDTHGTLSSDAEDMAGSAAWQAMEAERQFWLDRLPGEVEALLPWMLAQDATTTTQLLTFLVSSTVTGVYGTEPEQQRTDGLASALALDMNKWWQASASSYFNHVSKARIAEVVTEAVGAQAAAILQPLKKDAAATSAEQAMASANWLPKVLRLRPVAGEATDPDADGGSSDVASQAPSLREAA